jgi:hypothetical protein
MNQASHIRVARSIGQNDWKGDKMSTSAEETTESVKKKADRFDIEVAGTDLNFKAIVVDDPKVTGRQLIEVAGFRPVEDYAVLQWLPTNDLDVLRLNEETDLRQAGVGRFIIAKSDRLYTFEIEGERQEWPVHLINGATLKKLGGKDVDKFTVFLEQKDVSDLEIGDEKLVDLAKEGIEKFYFRAADAIIEIFVNTKTVKITSGPHTGLEIKEAAIAQNVAIKLDFVLSLETTSGHTKIIGDTDIEKVRAGQHYIAVADDDKS